MPAGAIPPYSLTDVSDDDDSDELAPVPLGWGHTLEPAAGLSGGRPPSDSSDEEEDDAVATFTHPQEVTNEEYDAVQTLLVQVRRWPAAVSCHCAAAQSSRARCTGPGG